MTKQIEEFYEVVCQDGLVQSLVICSLKNIVASETTWFMYVFQSWR